MKTKLATLLVVVLAVVSLSILFVKNNKPTIPKNLNNLREATDSSNFSQKSSLKSLLGVGKNLTCTYSFAGDDGKVTTQGKTYISGKKFAQEISIINSEDENRTLKTFMVSDGEYVYTWSEDKKSSGMKIKLEEPKEENNGDIKTDVASTKETMEKEYTMDCQEWNLDPSKFILPSDVKFTDLSEIMKNVPKMPPIPPQQ